jgi:hypothetical protein
MFRRTFGGLIALFALALTMVLQPIGAAAYEGTAGTITFTCTTSTVDGGQSIVCTATVYDPNGNVLPGNTVNFSQAVGPANCRVTFNPTSAVTNSAGQAQTTVTFPSSCPCQFTLTASSGGATGSTVIRENGCLPFTGAAQSAFTPDSPSGPFSLAWLAIAAGALAAGTGVMLLVRRRA